MEGVNGQRAQTAIELAVFGTIIVFSLGMIVRAGVRNAQAQHNMLRANRLAMTLSYNTSDSMNSAARNSASVLIVEDRLSVISGKHMAIDRTPQISQGSGTHSANLFMPIDPFDDEDLPLFDAFVNGKHFSFSTAKFKTVTLPTGCPGGASSCWEWESECVGNSTTGPCANFPDLCLDGTCVDCSSASTEIYTITEAVGCPKLYTIKDNYPATEGWCDEGTSLFASPCPASCDDVPIPGCNLSGDQRFDLDRNDLDGIPGDIVVPPDQRERFSWQWYLVMGVNTAKKVSEDFAAANLFANVLAPVNSQGLLMAEGIHVGKGINTLVDADNDLKLESVVGVRTNGRVITAVDVRDPHDGDVDFSVSDSDLENPPGFLKDVRIYSFVRGKGPGGGTFFRVEEGKLFDVSGDNKQYVRTVSKKDTVDVVERMFQLSNNTGRFCSTGPSPMLNSRPDNPVEVCKDYTGGCQENSTIASTCMDTENLIIFMRSRIGDFRGRKWVTDRSEDPRVDFMLE